MRCATGPAREEKRMLSEVLASKQIKEDSESLQIWGKDRQRLCGRRQRDRIS